MSWQDILNTILQISSRSQTNSCMEFLLLSCFESMHIKIADDRQPGKSESILKDRTSIHSWPTKKMGGGNHNTLRWRQVQVIALRKNEHTEGMMQSSAENIQGAGDVKPKRRQECCIAQQFKGAQCRPRARQREGTHQIGREGHFNWAARYLKFLWKCTVFTQTITRGRKKRTIWSYAKEMQKQCLKMHYWGCNKQRHFSLV